MKFGTTYWSLTSAWFLICNPSKITCWELIYCLTIIMMWGWSCTVTKQEFWKINIDLIAIKYINLCVSVLSLHHRLKNIAWSENISFWIGIFKVWNKCIPSRKECEMTFHSFQDKKQETIMLLIRAHQVYGISRVYIVFFLSIASCLIVEKYRNYYIAPKGILLADFFDLR